VDMGKAEKRGRVLGEHHVQYKGLGTKRSPCICAGIPSQHVTDTVNWAKRLAREMDLHLYEMTNYCRSAGVSKSELVLGIKPRASRMLPKALPLISTHSPSKSHFIRKSIPIFSAKQKGRLTCYHWSLPAF
jgi:hypothetical protein